MPPRFTSEQQKAFDALVRTLIIMFGGASDVVHLARASGELTYTRLMLTWSAYFSPVRQLELLILAAIDSDELDGLFGAMATHRPRRLHELAPVYTECRVLKTGAT